MFGVVSTKDCSPAVPFLPNARLLLSRVMAVARGKREDSLVFCGLVGIMDPPRASAIAFAERMQVRHEVCLREVVLDLDT